MHAMAIHSKLQTNYHTSIQTHKPITIFCSGQDCLTFDFYAEPSLPLQKILISPFSKRGIKGDLIKHRRGYWFLGIEACNNKNYFQTAARRVLKKCRTPRGPGWFYLCLKSGLIQIGGKND